MSLELNPRVCPLSFSNAAGVVAQCAGDRCGWFEPVAGECSVTAFARFFAVTEKIVNQ